MKRNIEFTEAQKIGVLRGLITVAFADGDLSDLETNFIESFGGLMLRCETNLRLLEPINPVELASLFPRVEEKRWVFNYCILVALADGVVNAVTVETLKQFRDLFVFDSAEFEAFLDIHNQNTRSLTRALTKWSYSGHAKRRSMRIHPLDFIRNRLLFRLRVENRALVEKYRALGSYKDGSLGKAFYDFVLTNDLGFPGDPESLSEYIVFHDLSHVLGEFGITPEEEVELSGFMAGYQSYNPFFTILTAICLFHLGMPTQGSDRARIQTMKWRPDAFFREMLRGSKCRVDLSDGWDHWPYMEKPLEQVRKELNIAPRFA